MKQKVTLNLFILLLLIPITTFASSQRTALIIGNSTYKSSPLTNPTNDARDMATVLKSLDFDVILLTDASKKQMIDAIHDFGKKLNKSEIGLFYYAGHGMQIKGTNYLIPVNTSIREESEVEFEAIDAGRVLAKMDSAGNPMNIVILDACRDNPFKRSFRTSKAGLARMDAPPGTVIAYATSPGSVAADGSGRNGTYTGALLRNLKNPKLDIYRIFNTTGLDVMKTTKNQQVPWISTTPFPEYYLANGSLPPEKPVPAKRPAEKPDPIVVGQQKSKPGDIWIEPTTGMEFVWVPGGCFMMGSNAGDSDETPIHEVCIDGFWMGKYEVTNHQFRQFRSRHDSKQYNSVNLNSDNHPAVYVSWDDAKDFITWMNWKKNGTFRLPTEAEWEYAARAGTKTVHFWGDDPDQACNYANVADRAAKTEWPHWTIFYRCNDGYAGTSPVGSFSSNQFGLFDMLGNVWEWCDDFYDESAYLRHPLKNPVVKSNFFSKRVFRGGSWDFRAARVRCADRYGFSQKAKNFSIGFRLVREP